MSPNQSQNRPLPTLQETQTLPSRALRTETEELIRTTQLYASDNTTLLYRWKQMTLLSFKGSLLVPHQTVPNAPLYQPILTGDCQALRFSFHLLQLADYCLLSR